MNKKLFLSLFSIWFCLMQPVQAQAISWEETWKTVKENKVTALAAAALVVVGYYAYKFYRNMTPTKKKVRFAEPLENIITFEPISEESEERPISRISPGLEQLPEKPEILPPVSQEIAQKELPSVTKKELKEQSYQPSSPATQIPQIGVPEQPQIPQGEQKDRPIEKNKTRKEIISEKIHFVSPDIKNLTELTGYLDYQLKRIENRLKRINDRSYRLIKSPLGEFVFVEKSEKTEDVEQKEYEKEISDLCLTLMTELSQLANQSIKNELQEILRYYYEEIQTLIDSASLIIIKFGTPESLYKSFERSLSHLSDVGLNISEAYETLGFNLGENKKNRYEITTADIDDAYRKLSQQKDYASTTDKGKQIRQAHFTLRNPIAKELYDAYLLALQTSPEAMSSLVIPEEDIKKFKLDHIDLSMELLVYKKCIESLLKKIK